MNENTKTIKEDNRIGPWLLSEETLIKLDSLMEKSFNDFKMLIEVKPEHNFLYDSLKKTLTIWFSDEDEIQFNSFKEAIVSDKFSNRKPIKFEYVSEFMSNRVSIILDSTKNNYFGYYINCKDDATKNNIIYDMQQIYNSERPKTFFSLASIISSYIFPFYIILLGILLLIFSDQYIGSYNKAIDNKVQQILSKGDLQQEDYFEIVKYTTIKNFKFYNLLDDDLLKIYNTRNLSNLYGKIILNYLIIGFIFCFIVTFNPKASFAVGKSKEKVKFWKSYYYILFKIIPIMIILPIVINIISYFITRNIY
jgi:hypothetical protein